MHTLNRNLPIIYYYVVAETGYRMYIVTNDLPVHYFVLFLENKHKGTKKCFYECTAVCVILNSIISIVIIIY